VSIYCLGVDLGTTYSAAVIWRGTDPVALTLGESRAAMPSVVWIGADGQVVVGDEAERRSVNDPDRSAREFKRRLGDPVPIVVGGQPVAVEALMAKLLTAIVAMATRAEGAPPTSVVLTHPANYSAFKIEAMRRVASLAGLPDSAVTLLTEPEAAAVAYTRRHTMAAGHAVAIYDFGGGTFDAAVVRRTPTRLELVGVPEGLERLGGIDFDQAILFSLDRRLAGAIAAAARGDTSTRAAQLGLRTRCRQAKETLVDRDRVAVAVAIGDVDTTVELTRDEFEMMIRPRIDETVDALRRSIESAGLGLEHVDRVLLVGGSSRIAMVGRLVAETTGRPVSTDMDPKMTIAEGAALMGTLARTVAPESTALAPQTPIAPLTPPPLPPTPPIAPPTPLTPPTPPGAPAPIPPPPTPPIAPRPIAPPQTPIAQTTPVAPAAAPSTSAEWVAPVRVAPPARSPIRRRRRGLAIGLMATAFAVAGAAAIAIGQGDGDGDSATIADSTAPATLATTADEPTTAPVTAPVTADAGQFTAFAFGGTGDPRSGGAAGSIDVGEVVALSANASGTVAVVTNSGLVLTVANGQAQYVGAVETTDGEFGGIAQLADDSIVVTTSRGVVLLAGGTTSLIVPAGSNGLGATPGPMAVDGTGSIYFVDQATRRIIRIGADRSLSLVAGTGPGTPTDIAGSDGKPAESVVLGRIAAMIIDRTGNLVYADADLKAVRRVSPDGMVSTVIGNGAQALGTTSSAGDARLGSVDGLALDANGGLVVAAVVDDAIVAVDPGGSLAVIGGDSVGPLAVLTDGTVVVAPSGNPATLVALRR
jgi:actin-like ATPase involved in cell morphogenesis